MFSFKYFPSNGTRRTCWNFSFTRIQRVVFYFENLVSTNIKKISERKSQKMHFMEVKSLISSKTRQCRFSWYDIKVKKSCNTTHPSRSMVFHSSRKENKKIWFLVEKYWIACRALSWLLGPAKCKCIFLDTHRKLFSSRNIFHF